MKKTKKILLIILAIVVIGAGSLFAFRKATQKTIVILLYDDFTMLEAIGASQTFPSLYLKNYTLKYVAKEKGVIKSSHIQTLTADYSFDEVVEADILYIPGGEKIENILTDEATIQWVKDIDATTEYTMSVGAGTLLLGKAGLLKGKKAATHWYHKKALEKFGATYANKNYVKDGKYYTGMGASASIDMVLSLINDIAGEASAKAMQLFIEYDPTPPVQSGTFDKADTAVAIIAQNMVDKKYADTITQKKTIAMMLYDGFTMLDITGPYQVFKELGGLGYQMKFVAKKKGIVPSDATQTFDATYSLADVNQADILFLPGGTFTANAMEDADIVNWVEKIDKTTDYTTSVCTGSMLLAKAGLLENRNATSHWYVGQFLKDYNATYSHKRYTIDGKYITGAGVSSGIDLALLIVKEAVSEDYAKAIQLKIGYFPNPPFDAGSPEKSDPATVDRLKGMYSAADKKYKEAKEAVIE